MSPISTLVVYPDLSGRVVLVTGGSGGIGTATCRAFAASGARVAVNSRRPEPVTRVVEESAAAGGIACAVPGDCSDPSAFDEVRSSVEDELGPIDILCAFRWRRMPCPADRQHRRRRLARRCRRQRHDDLGCLGHPDDVAAPFLSSSEFTWITGITLDVAGGQIIR